MEAKPLFFSKNNSVLLNVIRFVSAELVVLAHISEYYPGANLKLLHNAGNFAVGVFFILSGMLIATSAWNKRLKNEGYGFKSFFTDRFARIYSALVPALVIVLLVDLIACYAFGAEFKNLSVKTAIGNLLMLQEFPLLDQATYLVNKPWFDSFRIPFFGTDLPLWTLAIEWWLYLFFGWIALVKFRPKMKYLTVVLFLSIVPLFQLFVGSRMGPGVSLIWFFGVLMAFLLKSKQGKLEWLKTTFSIVAFTLIAAALYWFDYWFLAVFAFAIALYGILLKQQGKSGISDRKQTVINFFADYSFSLYLIHYSLLRLFTEVISFDIVWVDFIVLTLMVNIISIIVAEPFEKKHKQFRGYLGRKFSA